MTNAKKQPYTGPQMKKAIAALQAVAAQQPPSSPQQNFNPAQ